MFKLIAGYILGKGGVSQKDKIESFTQKQYHDEKA